MSENDKIDGTQTVPEPVAEGGGGRAIITDEDVLARDDLTTAQIGDADVHEPPARSALPDAPVAAGVGVGQGAHTPPDPTVFDRDGRVREGVTSDDAGTGTVRSDDGTAPDGVEPDDDSDEARIARLVDNHDQDELADIAESLGVAKTGTKPEVAERIVAKQRENEAAAQGA